MSPERIVIPRYCHQCGGHLIERVIRSERPPRLVCESCGFVHYMDARVVSAVIVERDGNVLLQQRAMGPRTGYWTFPGGFLEVGESTAEGALRETKEEVGLDVTLESLHGVYTRSHVGIVMVVYRGTSNEGEAIVADDESTAVRWFAPADIPWDELAFDTTIAALRDWVAAKALA